MKMWTDGLRRTDSFVPFKSFGFFELHLCLLSLLAYSRLLMFHVGIAFGLSHLL